jgi:ubiquinol-cytochrome c reductase cytochrome b subunit
MGTAFTGYVLPWGQMSFWGTVITSMVTAIPIAGQPIVGYGVVTVGNPTLDFSVYILLPFLIAGLTLIHNFTS